MTLIERYRAGACEAVWEELVSAGPDIRDSPIATDAMQVALETMTRVRANLRTLRTRLDTLGYRFGYYPDGTKLHSYVGPLEAPTVESGRHVDDLTKKAGSIPLSLESFWRVVGSVDFIGQHLLWPEHADPIVVMPPDVSIQEFADWQHRVELDGAQEAGPFLAVIAPDDFHKENVSGGSPYGFVLPNGAADALLEAEWHNLPFISYLRIAILDWGGFPGLSRIDHPLPSEIHSLRDNLLQF